MRFDDLSPDENAPIRPKSIVPPADRTSRTIRLKLSMLFAMLIIVILLMKEAGKPERWEWMGFETPKNAVELEIDATAIRKSPESTQGEQAETTSATENPASFPTETTEPRQSSSAIKIGTAQSGNGSGAFNSPSIVSIDLPSIQTDYPTAAIEFWKSEFKRISPEQQRRLLHLLKNIRRGETIGIDKQAEAQNLNRRLRHLRNEFHQTLFDRLALAADGTDEKTRLANEMYESQEIWDKKISPALDAASRGLDFTMGQRQAVLRLQQVLDPLLMQQVQDRTSPGWTGDSAAWIRIWEKVSNDEMPVGQPVTRIELMGQSSVYRGQPVTIEGWVRSARKSVLKPTSEIGLPHYFVLWIRPRESKFGPYCVYTMTLPDGFPEVGESFSDFNENVRFTGYFFKIRNYVAADSSVDDSPAIIAAGLERIETTNFTSVNRWQPSRSTLTTAFILIPLVATALAWLVFRNSKTHQYIPGKNSQQRIDQSLNELANNPNVETDRERVLSLYESDSHEP